MTQELELLEPERGVELYLRQRQDDAADSNIRAHRGRLKHFVRWCEQEKTSRIWTTWRAADCTSFGFGEKRIMTWIQPVFGLSWVHFAPSSSSSKLLTQCPTICTKTSLPALKEGEGVRDVMFEADRAKDILSYLSQFEYASRCHVIFDIFSLTPVSDTRSGHQKIL